LRAETPKAFALHGGQAEQASGRYDRQNARRRSVRCPQRKSGLGMPGVMIFHAFGQQAFATALPTSGQDGSTAFGFHPCPKTMLALAGPFRWLVGSFHAAARKGRQR